MKCCFSLLVRNANGSSIRHYLSERFRLRFEDANIEEMEENEVDKGAAESNQLSRDSRQVEAVDLPLAPMKSGSAPASPEPVASAETSLENGTFRTLDGELAGDEMEEEAINYQILLGKIDSLLERLRLDA